MSKTLENLKSGNYEVVDNQGVSVTQHFIECLEKEFAELETKLAESEKPKEIRFNGFVVDCNYDEARKVLQEDLLKMQAENKRLKEREELSNYAKCILENKKLEEDLELSEKCCVKYEQEIQELKQQLAEKDKEIEYQENMKILAVDNQNKKAIEQLEKVKEFVSRQLFITTKGCSDLDEAEAKGCNELREETIKEIDNQIKSLKGGE